MSKLNLYNKKLETCSTNPLTGAYRNGCCETGPNDIGTHTVCAIVTDEFLEYSKSVFKNEEKYDAGSWPAGRRSAGGRPRSAGRPQQKGIASEVAQKLKRKSR